MPVTQKSSHAAKRMLFQISLTTAISAALPAVVNVDERYDDASSSATVTTVTC